MRPLLLLLTAAVALAACSTPSSVPPIASVNRRRRRRKNLKSNRNKEQERADKAQDARHERRRRRRHPQGLRSGIRAPTRQKIPPNSLPRKRKMGARSFLNPRLHPASPDSFLAPRAASRLACADDAPPPPLFRCPPAGCLRAVPLTEEDREAAHQRQLEKEARANFYALKAQEHPGFVPPQLATPTPSPGFFSFAGAAPGRPAPIPCRHRSSTYPTWSTTPFYYWNPCIVRPQASSPFHRGGRTLRPATRQTPRKSHHRGNPVGA